jgi:hypothetical protein
VFLVRSAAASDWEDMAAGPGPDGKGDFLYVADFGDNASVRTDVAVYRIAEPKVGGRVGSKAAPRLTDEPTIRRVFAYPDGPRDAEALLVHPKTGVLYVVTKERKDGVAGVYRFPAEPAEWWEKNTLVKVGSLPFPGELVTGGDISPDGRRVALRTYERAYELTLPADAADFDAVWKAAPVAVAMPTMAQGEAITYAADGEALLATSEQLPAPLYELRRNR